MQYRHMRPVMYTGIEPDRINKCIFSGVLETEGEHNWRIVILRKTDMEYVGSCNADPDKSFLVQMDNEAYPDESLVAMCYDNSGTYNADILDNVSLCSHTFSVDVDQWTPKLESSVTRTQRDSVHVWDEDSGLRVKPKMPWLYMENRETPNYIEFGNSLTFVFDEETKGHFELQEVPVAPPADVGSLLDLPQRPGAIRVTGITASDGSASSIDVEIADGKRLGHTGMTHDLFGDGTCIASGRFKDWTLSIQGGYNMELYRRMELPYPKQFDPTGELRWQGHGYYDYVFDEWVRLHGYDGRLRLTYPWPMYQGTFAICWTMYWQDRGGDYVDLLTIEDALRVRMYYDDMRIYTYSYGTRSSEYIAYTLKLNAHYCLTFDDVANRVRLYEDGVEKLDASASDMNTRYAGWKAKHILYFGGQIYDPGYRYTALANFRVFHGRAISDAEAVTEYNDVLNLPAPAVYQIKAIRGSEKDLYGRFHPKVYNRNTSISMDSVYDGAFAALKGGTPPTLLLDSATYPTGEAYSTHTVSASDVAEDQTNFPLQLEINTDIAPDLFQKGADSWKYWEITKDGVPLQAEVTDKTTLPIDFESGSHTFTSIRFRFRDNYYNGSSKYAGVRRITFYDENEVAIPYDAAWVCEASSTYSTSYPAYRAFDTSSYSGSYTNAGWRSANDMRTWTELIVTFPAPVTIKTWRLYNWHSSGSYDEYGVRNTYMHGLHTGKFELLKPTPEGAKLLYNGMISKHDDDDSNEDDLKPIRIPVFNVRSVKFKVRDNYGGASYTGIRHIAFLYKGVEIPYDSSWNCEASTFAGEVSGASSGYAPWRVFGPVDNGNYSPSGESWRSREGHASNQGLLVTFPEPIKFDEIRVYNYFNNTSEYSDSVRYLRVFVNSQDPNYIFPDVDNWDDGPSDECTCIYSNYVGSAGNYNYAGQYTKLGLCWSNQWQGLDNLRNFQEAYLTVKVPTLSSSSDSVIKIRSTDVDQEAAGYVGLKGSPNAQAVWDATYEAVYTMEDNLNPMVDPYSKLEDSTSNELHSIAGSMVNTHLVPNVQMPFMKSFQGSTDNIKVQTPDAFATKTLDDIPELSLSAFLNLKESKVLGTPMALGDVLSLENMSLDYWAINVDGVYLNNSRAPIVLDEPKMYTINKAANSYSLLVGDALIGTDVNNSNARVSNAQRSITAKGVRFNFADNFGHVDHLGVRSIEFYYKGVLVPYNVSWVFDATSSEPFYDPRSAFDGSLAKDGAGVNNSWQSASGNVTNQVLTATFLNQETFDEIRINNFHDSGSDLTKGVDALTIDVNPISGFDTVWGSVLAGSQTVFDGNLVSHSASDEEDSQSPDIDNVTRLAKSVRFNCFDNLGDTSYMGIHRISFWKDGVRIPWDDLWTASATSYADNNWLPKFAFDESVGNSLVNWVQITWFSGANNITNQVLTINFPSAIEFDDISIDNGVQQGGVVGRGVKNMTIDIHATSDFTTTWGAALAGSQPIWAGRLVKHPEANTDFINNETVDRLLGFDIDQSTIGCNPNTDTNFVGNIGRVIFSNVVRSLEWNNLMTKSLRGELATHSETYGTTASDYVRYGFSFDNKKTYSMWTGTAWKPVASKEPSIHGVVDDYDWYYREAGTTWTKSPINTKEAAFSNAVNETTNRMTKTVVDALTPAEWISLNGFSDDGHFDLIYSMYQTSTDTCRVKYVGIDHTNKVALMTPISLDEYHEIIDTSRVEWVYQRPSATLIDHDTAKANFEANWKCYAIVTGGDWVEITNRGEIPGITAGMLTTGKTLQFKFEWTKETQYNTKELLPILDYSITTTA